MRNSTRRNKNLIFNANSSSQLNAYVFFEMHDELCVVTRVYPKFRVYRVAFLFLL